jgi:hypothetical protein
MNEPGTLPTPENLTHGIEEACYRGGPEEPYYQPAMDCMCGFSTGRCASWEDAGRELDIHLEKVLRPST